MSGCLWLQIRKIPFQNDQIIKENVYDPIIRNSDLRQLQGCWIQQLISVSEEPRFFPTFSSALLQGLAWAPNLALWLQDGCLISRNPTQTQQYAAAAEGLFHQQESISWKLSRRHSLTSYWPEVCLMPLLNQSLAKGRKGIIMVGSDESEFPPPPSQAGDGTPEMPATQIRQDT